MSDISLFEQLSVINDVYRNSLPAHIEPIETPHIRTERLPHQTSMVHGMCAHEMRMTHGFVTNNQIIHGKVGVVGDPPGSGKTLAVLSYISTLLARRTQQRLAIQSQTQSYPIQLRQGELNPTSNRYFYSHNIETVRDTSAVNLIIVPNHLFQQWRQEITAHTTFNAAMIDNRRVLRTKITPTTLCESDVVLVAQKVYRYIHDYAQQYGIRWKHVFIDDAASIHITGNDPELEFEFLWLISSHWLGFLFRNVWITPSNLLYIHDRLTLHIDCQRWLVDANRQTGSIMASVVSSNFLKQYIPYHHDARSTIVLRNMNSTLQESLQLPSPQSISIECRPYYTVTTLRQMVGQPFHTTQIPHIFESLGIQTYSADELIERYDERRQVIQNKMTDDCSICLDTPTHRVLTVCCMNAFCGNCILRHSLMHTNCPTCRREINFDDMANVISNSADCTTDLSGNVVIYNRHDTCLRYIREHRGEPMMLFTMFENNYYQLMPDLDRIGIRYARIEPNTMQRTLDDFSAGKIDLLFLSDMNFIRGVSLTRLQHLIFFYELAFSDQRELLVSSAQRVGRQTPLQVVQLYSQGSSAETHHGAQMTAGQMDA
jgi:hypothetical protein